MVARHLLPYTFIVYRLYIVCVIHGKLLNLTVHGNMGLELATSTGNKKLNVDI